MRGGAHASPPATPLPLPPPALLCPSAGTRRSSSGAELELKFLFVPLKSVAEQKDYVVPVISAFQYGARQKQQPQQTNKQKLNEAHDLCQSLPAAAPLKVILTVHFLFQWLLGLIQELR